MWNFGLDGAAWLLSVQIIITITAFAWGLVEVIRAIQQKRDGFSNQAVFDRAFYRRCCLKFGIFLALILTFFVFFGPGNHKEMHPAEENSHRKMLEKQPEPPALETVKAEAKEKVDPFLKQVDESPDKARKEANDYVQEIIKRNEENGGKKK